MRSPIREATIEIEKSMKNLRKDNALYLHAATDREVLDLMEIASDIIGDVLRLQYDGALSMQAYAALDVLKKDIEDYGY